MTKNLSHQTFQREWTMEREINHDDGSVGTFVGAALIDESWVYSEQGTLTMGGHSFAATRRYLWKPTSEGFDIYFDDGRPFHSLSFADKTADHWCDPDSYRVTYAFNAFPDWTATWTVSGPRKGYRMQTLYRPKTA